MSRTQFKQGFLSSPLLKLADKSFPLLMLSSDNSSSVVFEKLSSIEESDLHAMSVFVIASNVRDKYRF